MEQLEKDFITSYESHLAKEGKETCKEVDSIISDKDELMVEKAVTYCSFIYRSKSHGFDPKLFDRCKKYLIEMSNYRSIKNTFEQVNLDRKKNGLNN